MVASSKQQLCKGKEVCSLTSKGENDFSSCVLQVAFGGHTALSLTFLKLTCGWGKPSAQQILTAVNLLLPQSMKKMAFRNVYVGLAQLASLSGWLCLLWKYPSLST